MIRIQKNISYDHAELSKLNYRHFDTVNNNESVCKMAFSLYKRDLWLKYVFAYISNCPRKDRVRKIWGAVEHTNLQLINTPFVLNFQRTSEEIWKRCYWKSKTLAMCCVALSWAYELKLLMLSKFSINLKSVKNYGILLNWTSDITVYSNLTLYKHVYYFPTVLWEGMNWLEIL